MALLELSFATGDHGLSVRHFRVSEALSAPFEIAITAVSPSDDLDLEAFTGGKAGLRVDGGKAGTREWGGICSHFEQIQAEDRGLSTYSLTIVPSLWLLGHRKNNRIFQHLTIVEIVQKILGEWEITPVLRLDSARFARHEYRVQYGESDLAFVSRLLEEAGISYAFSFEQESGSMPVLSDHPESRSPRSGAIHFVDKPNPEADEAYLTEISVRREVRPGAFTVRDFDFRQRPDYELFGKSDRASGVEGQLEQYHYRPGALLTEGTPAQGHKAGADEREGKDLAARSLDAERSTARVIGWKTNLLELEPGAVFSMSGHPQRLAGKSLLSIAQTLEGTPGGEWSIRGRAVPADAPHRPAQRTPRPRIPGVQSALVVGPEGEEIHTDELGRVRVQFHWDREGKRDEHSTCFLRVSQSWAGAGYGVTALPRIGQEVTVGFFEGDPDQPMIIGRVHNVVSQVPYALPDNKTRTAWKSQSTPDGEGGYNELMFEDKKGAELIAIRAERDLQKLVLASEIERTGTDRTISVGRSRSTTVGKVDSTLAGTRHVVSIGSAAGGGGTSLEMIDRRIIATTGDATATFSGPDIALEAKGNITIISREGDVIIKGGPNVKINSD